ncbi:MAG TPA: dUTP diphosphatase [Clostridia bacterium]|jgi:dUTP pyrophosphatase|nr:dUTP diphosphatase [Clostridia bacterium]
MEEKVIIKIVPEGENKNIKLPVKMSPGASGFDLSAAIKEKIKILPGQRKLISTGIRIEIPRGYEGQIRPRSGLAWEHGVTILNSPGTIDSDYRGTLKIILINLGEEPFEISPGDRIAQLVIQKVPEVEFVKQGELSDSLRGHKGFGHTGR